MLSGLKTRAGGAGPAPRGDRTRVHLLLSSGGVRCLSYIGALEQLEAAGFEIATVSTCSAGTFVGALYCCGVGPADMREAALGLDLRELAGRGRWRRLRRAWSLRSWPYALYPRSAFSTAFSEILSARGLNPDPRLGDLSCPLSTAALDVAGQRLLVYSTDANSDMPVSELLRIAVAIPFLYPPHDRRGRVLLDAALASHTPIWLASGQPEVLPIVALRAPAPSPFEAAPAAGAVPARGIRRSLPAWVDQLINSSVVSRDTFLLERLPRVSVYDIETDVPPLEFDLTSREIERLIECGRTSVADQIERRREPEPAIPSRGLPDDDRAGQEAADLYGRHLDRLACERTSTVFLSYAREDAPWIQRLRPLLGELLADPDVSVWDDSYIKPGTLWDAAIEDAIRRATVAVLFVSNDFLASCYITKRELPLLRRRFAVGPLRVLWVSIDGSLPPEPEREFQGFVGPERSLGAMDEAAADRTLIDLARRIREEYTGG